MVTSRIHISVNCFQDYSSIGDTQANNLGVSRVRK